MKSYTFNNRILARTLLVFSLGVLFSGHAFALDIPASLQWSKRVELGTPISGVIKDVLANPADRVKQGAVLIKLDDRQYVAALQKARARVKALDERHKEAQRELERAQELYNRTVLSDHDLQTAKNAKVSADSEYETARAELVKAQLNLEYTTISAPFDAFVLQRAVEVGQTVVSELKPETLITVAAAGEMIARGHIEQAQLNGSLQGRAAQVVVEGKRYEGKVRHVGLEPVKTERQGIYYELDVLFNTGDRILRAGQQVTIILP